MHTSPTSLPGLTRQSIFFEGLLRSGMDARVKPAHDERLYLLRPRLSSAPRREVRRAALRPGHETSRRRFLLGADQLAVDQAFGDLDRVQRGALAQIVGDAPQRQPILNRGVLADAAYVGGV